MKILLATIIFLISSNVMADAACKSHDALGKDFSELVILKLVKVSASDYILEISGPSKLEELSIYELTVFKGARDNNSLAIPMSFNSQGDKFSSWLAGSPIELKELSVNVKYWHNYLCAVNVTKKIRITSQGSNATSWLEEPPPN